MGSFERGPARAAVERGVAEGEDAAVGRHQPVAAAVGCRRHADDGLVERGFRPCCRRTGRRRRRRHPRRAPPASSPWPSGVAAMATMGPCSGRSPSDPSKVASPKAKTPPSALASQYPPPSGVASPVSTGELRGSGMAGAPSVHAAEPDHPPARVARSGGRRPGGPSGQQRRCGQHRHHRKEGQHPAPGAASDGTGAWTHRSILPRGRDRDAQPRDRPAHRWSGPTASRQNGCPAPTHGRMGPWHHDPRPHPIPTASVHARTYRWGAVSMRSSPSGLRRSPPSTTLSACRTR